MGNHYPPSAKARTPATADSPVGTVFGPVALTMIIPAYNEAGRLPRYLRAVRHYMDHAYHTSGYEVLVVDDGSTDDTPAVADAQGRDWPQLRIVGHPTNRGKGAAVRTGMIDALGQRMLYADADGATPIEEEAKLRQALDDGADVAVGSRYLACSSVTRRRAWRRELIGRMFAAVARRVIAVPVRDTQCGFKMFSADAAHRLFFNASENGYLFDLEILGKAHRLGMRITEVPINWFDQPGSQLRLQHQLVRVPRDLWRVRREVRG